jgi:hypothetical protein
MQRATDGGGRWTLRLLIDTALTRTLKPSPFKRRHCPDVMDTAPTYFGDAAAMHGSHRPHHRTGSRATDGDGQWTLRTETAKA